MTVGLENVRATQTSGDTELFELDFDLTIRDEGPGVPKHEQDKIFIDFRQIDNNKDGLGLGLSICKNIVEKMGGTVTFESEEGCGSLFRIGFKT